MQDFYNNYVTRNILLFSRFFKLFPSQSKHMLSAVLI